MGSGLRATQNSIAGKASLAECLTEDNEHHAELMLFESQRVSRSEDH